MKSTLLSVLLLSVTLIAPSLALADADKDERVPQALTALGYKNFGVSASGTVRLVLKFDDERTQGVSIGGNPTQSGTLAFRDIYTIAYQSENPLPPEQMRKLMEANSTLKIGAWSVKKKGSLYKVMFLASIPADSDKVRLGDVLTFVALVGDKLEQELTGDDDL